jgi:hypothetical protein
MLVCRRDVKIAVLALKSLLRYPDMRLSVVLTDDGSLTEQDRAWIDHHVIGCRWLIRGSTDPVLVGALERRTRLATLYKNGYHPICKLLHPVLLSETDRVIVLDPDTAFFENPRQLADWCQGADEQALFLHDNQDETRTVPEEVRDGFNELRQRLAVSSNHWFMPYYFFNSGLLAYRPTQVDLDIAESYLQWREEAPSHYFEGKPGLWFGAWTPEQTAYQLIFAKMNPPSVPLGPRYAIGRRSGCVFNHFLWLQLVYPSSLKMLRNIIVDMGKDASMNSTGSVFQGNAASKRDSTPR